MNKKSIAVIGQGFVGGSLTTVMHERGFDVYAYDKAGHYVSEAKPSLGDVCAGYPTSISELIGDLEEGATSGFSGVYFVCVPTPMYEDGSADISIVESVLDDLAAQSGNRIAVIKSTIPPGTTEYFNKKYDKTGLVVCHSPEFLREATAIEDMRNQDRIIIGGPRPQIDVVRNIFRSAFPTVSIHKTSSTNSETIKYVTNTFLALKVSFANEIFQLVEKLQSDMKLDVDYDRIIELVTLDTRIGKSHLQVPGPMPADDGSGKLLPGYAGSCFIKDTNALIYLMKQLGIKPSVLEGGWEKNLEVRPERDWENLVGRAVRKKNGP